MGKVYDNIFKKELITPKSTPLHQGTYERGDAFVPDMSNQVMMQGLQSLSANAVKAYNNPRARGEGQLSRAEKRDRRGVRKGEGTMKTDATGKFNYEANDVNSKFNAKTSKIRKRGEDNIQRADIDTKYKAWMISRNNTNNTNNPNQNNTPGANPQGVAGVNTTGNTGNTSNTGSSKNAKLNSLYSKQQIQDLIDKREGEMKKGKVAVGQVNKALSGIPTSSIGNYNYSPIGDQKDGYDWMKLKDFPITLIN